MIWLKNSQLQCPNSRDYQVLVSEKRAERQKDRKKGETRCKRNIVRYVFPSVCVCHAIRCSRRKKWHFSESGVLILPLHWLVSVQSLADGIYCQWCLFWNNKTNTGLLSLTPRSPSISRCILSPHLNISLSEILSSIHQQFPSKCHTLFTHTDDNIYRIDIELLSVYCVCMISLFPH